MEPAPKPDPQTGEPRPPRATARRRFGDGKGRNHKFTPPPPPEGRGPCLESYAEKPQVHWQAVAGITGIIIVILSLQNGGLSWLLSEWYIPATVAALALIMGPLSHRGHFLAAGADWLQSKKGWVDTYNLSQIYVFANNSGGMFIDLRDHDGGSLYASLRELQENQELWDLVYNGILTSIQNGNVRIKGIHTRRALDLPDDLNPIA